jgi:hypothetical protein
MHQGRWIDPGQSNPKSDGGDTGSGVNQTGSGEPVWFKPLLKTQQAGPGHFTLRSLSLLSNLVREALTSL